MGMFLKCIGMWLLILWHKENSSVHGYPFVLPIRNLHDLKPKSTDVFARNGTHLLVNGVALRLHPFPNATGVMKQSRSSERVDSREGNRSLSEYLLKLYNETFLDVDHGNRSSRKGVVNETEIVPQEDVHSNVEGHGSSVESSGENIKKKKISTAEEASVVPANPTAQDSSLGSRSENQDEHNPSLDNKSTSVTLLSRIGKSLNDTNGSDLLYVIPVAIVALIVLVCVVFAVLFYKKHSNLQKWTAPSYYRYNEQMDIELADVLVHSPRYDTITIC